jgi:hypothetical protein
MVTFYTLLTSLFCIVLFGIAALYCIVLHSEADIKGMLGFPVDIIYVVFVD